MESASSKTLRVILTVILTMSSVWKHPKSQFWTACYTDENGVQRKRSTKETNRAKALLMAQKFEGAYRTKLTEAQARKVVSDIYQEIHGEQLFHASVRKFFTDWLANKKAELQPGAHKRYENAVDKLLDFLAERADRDIAYVHKRDITALRDQTATTLSASTANTDLKILRSAFKQAVSDGLRLDNSPSTVFAITPRRGSNALACPSRSCATSSATNPKSSVAITRTLTKTRSAPRSVACQTSLARCRWPRTAHRDAAKRLTLASSSALLFRRANARTNDAQPLALPRVRDFGADNQHFLSKCIRERKLAARAG